MAGNTFSKIVSDMLPGLPSITIFLFAGLAWLYIWRGCKGLTRILWTGGAFAWGSSQLLEATQWGSGDEKIEGYNASMVTEELLEMIGSGLFLLALIRLFPRPR